MSEQYSPGRDSWFLKISSGTLRQVSNTAGSPVFLKTSTTPIEWSLHLNNSTLRNDCGKSKNASKRLAISYTLSPTLSQLARRSACFTLLRRVCCQPQHRRQLRVILPRLHDRPPMIQTSSPSSRVQKRPTSQRLLDSNFQRVKEGILVRVEDPCYYFEF